MREWTLLVVAAILEVGGDALMRYGLRSSALTSRVIGFGLSAVVLFAYGVFVNLPKWNFGRLLGVYIAIFFVVSQIVSLTVFRERLRAPTLVGGLLIVAGGLVLTFWRTE
jgi:multidrug transporter EmrE-like cation transporter